MCGPRYPPPLSLLPPAPPPSPHPAVLRMSPLEDISNAASKNRTKPHAHVAKHGSRRMPANTMSSHKRREAAPRPFRPHIHKIPCRRLDLSGARSPNHRQGHLCTWDPCPTVKEGCPRRATGGNRGRTVPLTTEAIGDLRRGRRPRYRWWMCSR